MNVIDKNWTGIMFDAYDVQTILNKNSAEYFRIKAMGTEEFIEYNEYLKTKGCRVIHIDVIDSFVVLEYTHKPVKDADFRIQFRVRTVKRE